MCHPVAGATVAVHQNLLAVVLGFVIRLIR